MKLKEDYMDGDFSYRDRRRMEQGKAPEWATKMEEIGPRKKKLRQSSSYSEIAMRSVNSPDGKVKKDHLESDWRAEKEGQKKMNRTIAAELKKMLGTGYRIETEDFADYFSIYKDVGNEVDEYRIYSRGGRYFVKYIGHKSIFDVKTKMCNSLKEIVEFMKLDEAVKVLKKNGYKLVEKRGNGYAEDAMENVTDLNDELEIFKKTQRVLSDNTIEQLLNIPVWKKFILNKISTLANVEQVEDRLYNFFDTCLRAYAKKYAKLRVNMSAKSFDKWFWKNRQQIIQAYFKDGGTYWIDRNEQ